MGHYYDYYDQQLTAGLWSTLHAPSTHTFYSWSLGSRSTLAVTGSKGSSSQTDGEDTYYNYHNFRSINSVDFTVTFGGNPVDVPGTFDCGPDTSMTNVTLAGQGVIAGDNVKLDNLTFTQDGGWIAIAGSGAALNGLTANRDFGDFEIYGVSGGSASAANVTVNRNLWTLAIGASAGELRGSGVSADKITVSGRLRSGYVASGAVLNSLTVGQRKAWGGSDVSAFVYYDDGWGSWTHSSATYLTIASGGTASNIFLDFGGEVRVEGPDSLQGTGIGGILTNFQMAVNGGVQLAGIDDPSAIWNYPTNGYANSRDYMSGFRATAPQSAYLQFDQFTIGSNITIGNGGSMRISSGASVTNITMSALSTQTYVANSSGGTDTWIGDRGAYLAVNGGFASNVVVEALPMTFEYYSAAYDYFWLYSSAVSSSMREAYSSEHGEDPSGEAWEARVHASAKAGYRQYMSDCYVSGGHYTQLGDDTTGYNHKWVGGEVHVDGGRVENLSDFATLAVTHYGDGSSSGGRVYYSAYATDNVSKALGRISATIEVGGGAHLTSVTAPGGMIVMGANGSGMARWSGHSDPQSNFARVEHLDLRTSGLLGDHNSAVVIFVGNSWRESWSTPRRDTKGKMITDDNGDPIYDHYEMLCKDPGEIVFLSADPGLAVSGTYGKFTYTGTGALVLNGLGTIYDEQYGSRYYSSTTITSGGSTYKTVSRWLAPASGHVEFGVVKGVYDEETGKLQRTTVLDGDAGFDWKGVLAVGSGAVVTGVGSKTGLKTANTLTSDSLNPVIEQDVSKMLYVLAGGSADNVTVTGKVTNYEITSSPLYRSNAALLVSSHGTATNVTLLSGGIAMAQGGTINGAFVGSGGIVYLSGWGGAVQVSSDGGEHIAGAQYLDTTVLNGVRLDAGGRIGAVYDYQFGGKAPSIIANKGGGILNGITANGVAYASGVDFAGNMTLTKDQKGVDLTVRAHTEVTATDASGNPTAWTTTIATLNVSSGASATGTTVSEDGAIYAGDGANVNSTTLVSGGRLIFENAGSGWGNYLPGSAAVNGVTISGGGLLDLNSKFAVTAANIDLQKGGGIEFVLVKNADDDHAKQELSGKWSADWGNGTFKTQNGVLSGFGGDFGVVNSNGTLNGYLSATVANGGVISGADLRGNGDVIIADGGKILDTHVDGVDVCIVSGGCGSGVSTTIQPTAYAYDTEVTVNGSGAVADATHIDGGYLGVGYGGVVNDTLLTSPDGWVADSSTEDVGPTVMEVMEGGVANNTTAMGGVISLYSGSGKSGSPEGPAKLSNADVHSAAKIEVLGDGVILDGTLHLGGTIDTTSRRWDWVEVPDPDNPGATIGQRVANTKRVADASTLTVNFDLTERNGTEEGAMIDNLANLSGAKLSTITVGAAQESGKYLLAQGASAFAGSLTVSCDGKKIGDFTVGTYLQVSEEEVYSLTNDETAGLCFTVQNTAAAVTDIIASVDGKPLEKGKWTNKAITIKTQVNKYSQSIWYKIVKASQEASGSEALSGAGSVSEEEGDDGWTKLDNTKGITVSQYCDIQFKAKNDKGKDSRIVTYTVNYDATAAVISDFRSDAGNVALTAGMESRVSVSVTDNLDAAPTLELNRAGTWTAVSRGADGRYSFTVTGNGKYSLRAADHAGNLSVKEVTVDFYDRPSVTAPEPDKPGQLRGPTGLTVSVSKYNATLVWEKYDAEKGVKVSYEVFVDGEKFGTKSNKYSLKNADVGVHTFAVRAVFGDGSVSNWSSSVRGTVVDSTAPKTGALTVEQTNDNAVKLAWTAATDNVGINRYVVTCGSESREVSGTTLSAEFHGVAGKVDATVTAYDAAGNAGKTVKKSIKLADVTAPAKVTGLAAQGVVDNKSGGILTWNAATDNVGVAEYLISVEGLGKIFKSKTNSVKIGKLPAGEHTFTVIAVDKAKNESPVSAAGHFTVADSVAPKTGALTVEQTGADAVKLVWTAATDDDRIGRYLVTCGSESREVSGTTLSAEFHGVAGKVDATVTAYDAAGNAGKTVKKSIKLADVTAPTKVTGLAAQGVVDNKSGGILTWEAATDNVGVTQYLIAVEGQGKVFKSKTNSVKVGKLPAGEHTFTVIAVDKAKNESPVSAAGHFTVADAIAPKVKKLSAKVTGDTALVTWNAVDETGIVKLELAVDGNKAVDVTGRSSRELADLAPGVHVLRIAAYDTVNMAVKEISCSVKEPKVDPILAAV